MHAKLYFFLISCMILLFATGCQSRTASIPDTEAVVVVDGVGRRVSVAERITRVAVANRYNMEVIKSIGAMDKVSGIDYGIYQDQAAYGALFDLDQVIGKSQSDLNYEKIIQLQPQVLILTSNGSWREAEEKLAPFGIRVVVMDAYYTAEFANTYALAGKIFGKEKESAALVGYFQEKLQYIEQALQTVPVSKVYFEYKKSGTTTVPGDYFFDMLAYAHAESIFKDARSTEIDIEAVVQRNPDAIIKVGEARVDPKYTPPSTDAFEKRRAALVARPGWETITAVQNDKILLLSQYAHGGAAKLVGTMYIAKFLYPEYLPELHPEEIFKVWVTKYQGLEYLPGHTYPAVPLDG